MPRRFLLALLLGPAVAVAAVADTGTPYPAGGTPIEVATPAGTVVGPLNDRPASTDVARTPGVRPMIGYSQVIESLDAAVGGPGGPPHQAFWRGLTRDRFTAAQVLGLPLHVVDNGGDSNLLKVLRGAGQFDGSEFDRRPTAGA